MSTATAEWCIKFLSHVGKVYIGQTGRCINTRLREHALTLKSTPSGHLAMHVRDCSCTPLLSDTKVIRRFKDKRNREIFEAQTIQANGGNCVSTPSLALTEKEVQYLNHYTWQSSELCCTRACEVGHRVGLRARAGIALAVVPVGCKKENRLYEALIGGLWTIIYSFLFFFIPFYSYFVTHGLEVIFLTLQNIIVCSSNSLYLCLIFNTFLERPGWK